MSIPEAFRKAQQASQSAHIGRSVPAANRLNLADHLRLRQMERMLQQTLEELEQAKTRIHQLEKLLTKSGRPNAAADKITGQQTNVSSLPPLPIDEIKKLAEMAKRFK